MIYDTPMLSKTIQVPAWLWEEMKAEAKARHMNVQVVIRERLAARRPEEPGRKQKR